MRAGDFRWPAKQYRAFIASVIDAVHLPLSEIAKLTDSQLIDVYNHPRDKDGRIKVPEEPIDKAPPGTPPSLERDLCLLTVIAGTTRMPAEKYAALKQQLEAKWAAKESEATDGCA